MRRRSRRRSTRRRDRPSRSSRRSSCMASSSSIKAARRRPRRSSSSRSRERPTAGCRFRACGARRRRPRPTRDSDARKADKGERLLMRNTCLAFAIAAIGGIAIHGQETRSSTLLTTEHYLDWERVSDAQIAPDASRIVYTRQHVNKLEDKWESEIWLISADGSQNRFLVKGESAKWSPDGKRLMYLADGEPKGQQIFVRWVDANGPATQITHVADTPRNAGWSPDGKAIAFSMFVAEKEKWNISMPEEPKGGKWTPAPRIVDTLHFRQDRTGFLEDGFTHLFVVPADGGTPRALTSGRWNVGAGELRGGASIDWTPDSKSIVFDGVRNADGDLKYQVSSLYVVDVASGSIRDL